jgi:hypothetical protein
MSGRRADLEGRRPSLPYLMVCSRSKRAFDYVNLNDGRAELVLPRRKWNLSRYPKRKFIKNLKTVRQRFW